MSLERAEFSYWSNEERYKTCNIGKQNSLSLSIRMVSSVKSRSEGKKRGVWTTGRDKSLTCASISLNRLNSGHYFQSDGQSTTLERPRRRGRRRTYCRDHKFGRLCGNRELIFFRDRYSKIIINKSLICLIYHLNNK